MSAVLPVITSECKSLVVMLFESDSHLERMEAKAFAGSAIAHIFVPRSVDLIGSKCFPFTQLLSWIEFESYSRLKQIEDEAFAGPRFECFRFHGALNFSESRALRAADRLRFASLVVFKKSLEFQERSHLRERSIFLRSVTLSRNTMIF
jgi:hypothetical protein